MVVTFEQGKLQRKWYHSSWNYYFFQNRFVSFVTHNTASIYNNYKHFIKRTTHICVTTKNACMNACIHQINQSHQVNVRWCNQIKIFSISSKIYASFHLFHVEPITFGLTQIKRFFFTISHNCRLVYALFVLFTFSWMLTIFWSLFSRNEGYSSLALQNEDVCIEFISLFINPSTAIDNSFWLFDSVTMYLIGRCHVEKWEKLTLCRDYC